MAASSAPPPHFFQRPLAWLVDWALPAVFASGWYVLVLPWWKAAQDDVPWPLSEVLPWAVRLSPVLFALALMLLWDLGRWRRSVGMALMGLGVVDRDRGIPTRSRMLGRRLASLLSWLTLGLGFIPAFFGKRLALHDRLSGTCVLRQGTRRPWLALLLGAASLFSIWGLVRWGNREPVRDVIGWGYLDRAGRVVIEPRFEDAKPFRDGWAIVRDEGEWHWLDGSGRLHARLGAFESYLVQVQGMAVFQDKRIRTTCMDLKGQKVAQAMGDIFPPLEKGQPMGFLNLQGHATFRRLDGSLLTNQTFEEVWPFHEGLGRFKIGGKVGAVDTQGQIVIQPVFDEIESFDQSLAPARLDKLWGLLNREGRWVVKPRFEEMGSLNQKGADLVAAKLEGHWGYIRRDGTWAIPPRFDLAKGFTEGGWARVKVGEHWGVIDAAGAWVLEARYERVSVPREAPFAFRQGLRWGYIAPGGRVVVAPMFSQAGRFRNGVAFSQGLHRWFRVEASGRLTPLPLGWSIEEEDQEKNEWVPFARSERKRP